MKNFLTLFLIICCLFRLSPVLAQTVPADEKTKESEPEKEIISTIFQRSAGVHLSSQGVGFEVQHPLPFFMNLRLGASILPNLNTSGSYTLNGYKTQVNAATSKIWNAHLMVDYQPFHSAQSSARKFILTVGAGYFPEAKGSALVQFAQDYSYGDMKFSPNEVGMLNTVSSWAGFAPYGGIGVNNLVSRGKFNLNLGLGAYYMEAPKVTITGTNMLSGNSDNALKLAKNLSSYRWLPVLQLNFNYNL